MAPARPTVLRLRTRAGGEGTQRLKRTPAAPSAVSEPPAMRSAVLLVAALCLARAFSPPWAPASWARVQVQAFPGSSSRFMNASELAQLARFDMINEWGLNVTCLHWNGTGGAFPAACGDGGCSCAAPTREQQLFATDMDAALHAQAAALKAARPLLPVVGYIDFPTAQMYFPAQLQLCTDPALAKWRLATAANGVVDCFQLPPAACNHQGMEFCQPDFRIPEARDWWVGTVLRALLDAPSIDGSFLDECDQFYEMCGHIGCSPAELAGIEAGTLLALDAALAAAAALGKWLVVSVTATRSTRTPVHASLVASLLAHKSGFRFYEGFSNVDQMLTMAEEVEAGVRANLDPRARRAATPRPNLHPPPSRQTDSRAGARVLDDARARLRRARPFPARRGAVLVLFLFARVGLWLVRVAARV